MFRNGEPSSLKEALVLLLSRKFLATMITMGLFTLVVLLSVKYAVLKDMLTSFGSLILGALAVYLTGNISNKIVNNKLIPQAQNDSSVQQEEEQGE